MVSCNFMEKYSCSAHVFAAVSNLPNVTRKSAESVVPWGVRPLSRRCQCKTILTQLCVTRSLSAQHSVYRLPLNTGALLRLLSFLDCAMILVTAS